MEGTIETLDVVTTITADQIDTKTIDQNDLSDKKGKNDRNAALDLNHHKFLKDCLFTEPSCMVSHMRLGTKT